MIWIYIAIAIVVGIPLLLAAIGLLLAPGHVATRTARYARSPEQIWDVISDPVGAAAWRPELERVELRPPVDGRTSYVEHGKHGAIPFVVEELTPPRRMVVRILDDKLPFGGRWIFTVTREGEGESRLTITEDGFVKNPIFRTLSRTVFSLSATLEKYLRSLGARFGETTTPEPGERVVWPGSAT